MRQNINIKLTNDSASSPSVDGARAAQYPGHYLRGVKGMMETSASGNDHQENWDSARTACFRAGSRFVGPVAMLERFILLQTVGNIYVVYIASVYCQGVVCHSHPKTPPLRKSLAPKREAR